MDFEELNKGYAEIQKAIEEKAAPGAVVLIAKDGKIIRRRAFGYAQLYSRPKGPGHTIDDFSKKKIRMRTSTVFDLASLTKVIVTTTCILILKERELIDLDSPACRYWPEFGQAGKDTVTVRHLLTHTSGLASPSAYYEMAEDKDEVLRLICEQELDAPPGYQRVYSDIGFIVLGEIVEKVSKTRLDRFAEEKIFRPLGMNDTCFRPGRTLRSRCAATEYSERLGRLMMGEVHDENAYCLGGIAGHAGLFSTAEDLAIFCQMLLNGGGYGDVRILQTETVGEMLTSQISTEAIERGSAFLQGKGQLIGWWSMGPTVAVTAHGGLPSQRAFGHTGFTGTSIWVDPEHNVIAILLTNAIHPRRDMCNRERIRKAFYSSIWNAMGRQAQGE
ncbi:MAG TPA: serine hydrolase domain-containing protein [bacterium]|nr:serine hydrolase domain-containing protein [bacterium]HQL61808.1 serine hydrolase domain-containing protein [bacterium]